MTDVLFPYARKNVQRHLEETYDTDFTQDDIKLLRSQVRFINYYYFYHVLSLLYIHLVVILFFLQVEDDLQHGVVDAVPVPPEEAGKQAVIAALVANVEGMIKSDRKITSLKQLQVSKSNTQNMLVTYIVRIIKRC